MVDPASSKGSGYCVRICRHIVRRQHVAGGFDLVQARRLAKARHVFIPAGIILTTPGMIGAGDLVDVSVREFLACES